MQSTQNHSPKIHSMKGFGVLKMLIAVIIFCALAAAAFKFTQQKEVDTAPKAQIAEKPAESTSWQPTIATEKTNPDTPAPISSYHDAVSRAAISVVNIYTTQKITNNIQDPALRYFFEYYGQEQQSDNSSSLGSGVIVSKDGYIITNAHVIDKADEITVALNDGRKAHAKVVGTDSESDLAVIKIDLDNLTPLAFRGDPIRVGDVALAIGNPFGVGQTVTQGIISATGRTGLGVSTFEDFIQTDAAINPGNSGGALVDANGALVGINTVIYSRSGGSMGIGFAIPTSIVEQVMNALISTGKVSRGWLGIEIAPISENPTQIEEQDGVIIANVMADGPADIAGLKRGDVILSLDGTPTKNPNTLIGVVSKKSPNSILQAVILRDDQKQTIDIKIGERPSKKSQEDKQNQEMDERTKELLQELERMQKR